ncbi:hypothetical protein ACHAXN_010302 [Cyclotella atomus]
MESTPPKCHVAVVGLSHQRVARVISLLNEPPSSKIMSPIHQYELSESDLPSEIPLQVEIEYIPCVATFDSYEDQIGNIVRYLAKLEYHGEFGTSIKGQSLAPFFDVDGGLNAIENPFPGFAAVVVGCGIDTDEDVEKIASFINMLTISCTNTTDVDESKDDSCYEVLVECIKCNPEYSSMKEENDAYRNLSEAEKSEAIASQTIGPGKMAKFAAQVAKKTVSLRWAKELQALEHEKNKTIDQDSIAAETTMCDVAATDAPPPSTLHIPDPEKTRYACKRCRTVLFGQSDLEDPPHAQSLHNFRKKSASKMSQSKVCANHFLANPLPWMSSMDGMEGKLHCFKCDTKIGHYSWTGAQCSCGTWVTPAIMIPMSKVDEMLPSGSILFVDPNNDKGEVRTHMVFAVDKGTITADDISSLPATNL